MPLAGWVLDEFGIDSVREIVFGSYRIVYRYDGRSLLVLFVVHGSRLMSSADLSDE